jgi:hypothetical protein
VFTFILNKRAKALKSFFGLSFTLCELCVSAGDRLKCPRSRAFDGTHILLILHSLPINHSLTITQSHEPSIRLTMSSKTNVLCSLFNVQRTVSNSPIVEDTGGFTDGMSAVAVVSYLLGHHSIRMNFCDV